MSDVNVTPTSLAAMLVAGTVQPGELTLSQMVAVHNEFNPDSPLKAFQSKEKGAARLTGLIETAREAQKREPTPLEESDVQLPTFIQKSMEDREALAERVAAKDAPAFIHEDRPEQGARADAQADEPAPEAQTEAEPAKTARKSRKERRAERAGASTRGREAKFGDDQKIRVLKGDVLSKRKGKRGDRASKLKDGMTVNQFALALGDHGRALRDLRRDVAAGVVSVD
jgi:hypothetical protein